MEYGASDGQSISSSRSSTSTHPCKEGVKLVFGKIIGSSIEPHVDRWIGRWVVDWSVPNRGWCTNIIAVDWFGELIPIRGGLGGCVWGKTYYIDVRFTCISVLFRRWIDKECTIMAVTGSYVSRSESNLPGIG